MWNNTYTKQPVQNVQFHNVVCPQVRHQVAYLGLVENVRVRRAGFASRQRYDRFLQRYKMLSQYTWPNFRGAGHRDAVMVLLRDLRVTDVQYGHTKLFIRLVVIS